MTPAKWAGSSIIAASHPTAGSGPPRWARRIGASRRVCCVTVAEAVRCSVLPLVQSRPKFAGWSGSPRTPTICGPAVSTITPQPTPQYGQVERVSGTARPRSDRGALGRRRLGADRDHRGHDRGPERQRPKFLDIEHHLAALHLDREALR